MEYEILANNSGIDNNKKLFEKLAKFSDWILTSKPTSEAPWIGVGVFYSGKFQQVAVIFQNDRKLLKNDQKKKKKNVDCEWSFLDSLKL